MGILGVLSLIGRSPATNVITATKEFGTGAALFAHRLGVLCAESVARQRPSRQSV
jgi:hypothetical protein